MRLATVSSGQNALWKLRLLNSRSCRTCFEVKPLEAFQFRKETSKYRTQCECCRSTHGAARRYGVTVGNIEELRVSQDNSCAICGIPADEIPHKTFKYNPLVIDHDHMTGKVRGLLCPTCNSLLGHAKDSEEILQAAIRYLTATT